jgi:hypothetical protein
MQKMLLVIYRFYMEERIHELLTRLEIQAFSETTKLLGAGVDGKVADSYIWPGYNASIFTVVPDADVPRLSEGFRQFVRDHEDEYGSHAPLRVFVLPCEQLI